MDKIYADIAAFRADPEPFHPSCGWGNLRLPPFRIDPQLEEAAMFQASHRCGFPSHQTCPEYCHLFGNKCDHVNRIRSFIWPNTTAYNLHELIVMGPKNPVPALIGSPGHCEKLLASNENAIGGAICGNLFVLVLAWINFPR